MELIEQFAQAALNRDHLLLRSLVQDSIHAKVKWSDLPRPQTSDQRILVMAASLIELLAARQKQTHPAWTKDVGPLKEPFFLLQSVEKMKRLRVLCETQSPEPLRKRNLYAPPHFLEFS